MLKICEIVQSVNSVFRRFFIYGGTFSAKSTRSYWDLWMYGEYQHTGWFFEMSGGPK